MAATAGGGEAAPPSSLSRKTTSFFHLPPETQQDVVSHCSQADLVCVALVCKRFHELASAQLYRNFHIVFPDEDDINFDSPIDGLAGGLDTFTTSDYNYAKYLRDLSMDTLSAGSKGEKSYQPYVYTASCGKFLNSLLHLTLRKATALETFRWNIRVELSRPVYRELHRIQSLTRLHVRMQNGSSYYSPPPPLPASVVAQTPEPANHWPTLLPQLNASQGPPGMSPPPPANPLFFAPSKSASRSKNWKSGLGRREPSTFSGFKNLKALSVLDIDSLDVVPEIRACVKNSFSTLKELQLSLSDGLAQQSRKPPPESDVEDSDLDDEFQVVSAQSVSYDASGPAKAFRAQEERKVHEAILGKIFDIDQTLIKKSPIRHLAEESAGRDVKGNEPSEGADVQTSHETFISSIKQVSARLVALRDGSCDFSVHQQDILDIIEKAARKYVDSCDDSPPQGAQRTSVACEDTSEPDKVESDPSVEAAQQESRDLDAEEETCSIENTTDGSSPSTTRLGVNAAADFPPRNLLGEDTCVGNSAETSKDRPSVSPDQTVSGAQGEESTHGCQTTTNRVEGCSSTDLETTQPLCEAVNDHRSALAGNQPFDQFRVTSTALEPLWERFSCLQKQFAQVTAMVQDFQARSVVQGCPKTGVFDAELNVINQSVGDMFNEIRAIETDALVVPRQKAATRPMDHDPKKETVRRSMAAYARETRGLSVESLSIHLVPVKASILSRGVDLACLKQLTLLNVGNQVPVWTLLTKECRTRPLALRSVFTDHVTTAFLSCMAELPELHDMFLLERSAKHKPESFAARTTTTIDQIRRLVLKRHVATLRRLMIKDETNGPNWDVNEKTMILICTRGALLEELALSMNIHAVHAFMQYFSGLVNLRAINILHFKNNDTCIWVMREILRFIVDNLSHHPELKLEWIAIEDERVDRVVRPSEAADEAREAQPTKRSKEKGKNKAHVADGVGMDGAYPLLPMDGLESESDSDGEMSDSGCRLRFKTVGPLQFYDVWGVKIFEKEIRSGRL